MQILIPLIRFSSFGFQFYSIWDENFDSLNINKKLILYDLFVKEAFRKKRIGRKLMNTAKKFAVKKSWLLDIQSVNLSEIFGATLGVVALMFGWKKNEKRRAGTKNERKGNINREFGYLC